MAVDYCIEYNSHNCPLFRKTRINLKAIKSIFYDANTAIFIRVFVQGGPFVYMDTTADMQ